jgi:hypothetical protein
MRTLISFRMVVFSFSVLGFWWVRSPAFIWIRVTRWRVAVRRRVA